MRAADSAADGGPLLNAFSQLAPGGRHAKEAGRTSEAKRQAVVLDSRDVGRRLSRKVAWQSEVRASVQAGKRYPAHKTGAQCLKFLGGVLKSLLGPLLLSKNDSEK